MQNFASGGFSVPHDGQLGASAVPHDMQNRARSGFSVPQLGQTPPAIGSKIRKRRVDGARSSQARDRWSRDGAVSAQAPSGA